MPITNELILLCCIYLSASQHLLRVSSQSIVYSSSSSIAQLADLENATNTNSTTSPSLHPSLPFIPASPIQHKPRLPKLLEHILPLPFTLEQLAPDAWDVLLHHSKHLPTLHKEQPDTRTTILPGRPYLAYLLCKM